MQLTVAGRPSIRHGYDVGVVEQAVVAPLDQPGTEAQVVVYGEVQEGLRRRARRHGLGQGVDGLPREIAHVPVAGEAHLRESNHVYVLRGGLFHEDLDGVQIGGLIARRMLELHGGGSDVLHETSSILSL